MSHGGDTAQASISWIKWNLSWTVNKRFDTALPECIMMHHLCAFTDEVNILLMGGAEGRHLFEALASTRPASECFKKLVIR